MKRTVCFLAVLAVGLLSAQDRPERRKDDDDKRPAAKQSKGKGHEKRQAAEPERGKGPGGPERAKGPEKRQAAEPERRKGPERRAEPAPGPARAAKGPHAQPPVHAFRDTDRGVITGYYRRGPGGPPPGHARRDGDLPPGLEKQLRRNGRLPPGLDKRMVAFPAGVESRLPPCPPGVRRGLIGGVAVMFNTRTGIVLDFVAVGGL